MGVVDVVEQPEQGTYADVGHVTVIFAGHTLKMEKNLRVKNATVAGMGLG